MFDKPIVFFFFFLWNPTATFDLSFKNGSVFKVEKWVWVKVSNGWGLGNLGILIFKWWVISDEWRKLSKEWWVMKKKKNQTAPKSIFFHNLLQWSSNLPTFSCFSIFEILDHCLLGLKLYCSHSTTLLYLGLFCFQ